jgi:hypothetical protein
MEIGTSDDSVGNECWSEIGTRESIERFYKEKILESYNVNNNVTIVLKKKIRQWCNSCCEFNLKIRYDIYIMT